MDRREALEKVRKLVARFPDVVERESHGMPAWFIAGKRQFAALADDHHGDGRLALWCAAPDGAQSMLVEASPEHYFAPPYVGPSGWVGVRLDRGVAWKEVAAVVEEAYATRAAKKTKPAKAATPKRRAVKGSRS